MAQHPESFEDIEELDEEDKITIREEKTRELSTAFIIIILNSNLDKWRLPWALYYTVAICSLGSAIQYVSASRKQMR